MKKVILFLSVGLLFSTLVFANTDYPTTKEKLSESTNNRLNPIKKDDIGWRIGGKIHFEEKSGPGYIGTQEINKITKTILKENIKIEADTCSNNSKIMLKKENAKIIMTHYEEKSRPRIGEETHATLLYSKPRGFNNSETLKQVCGGLFEKYETPPTIQSVVKKYSAIIKPEWKLKISEIVLIKGRNNSAYIAAKLLLNGRENIYNGNKPISSGLHITLVNCTDASILSDHKISNQLIEKLNLALKNKMVKIATKHGVVDLEFGISGALWRIRAGEIIKKSGGESEIRTHGGLTPSTVFKTAAFGRSAISPKSKKYLSKPYLIIAQNSS